VSLGFPSARFPLFFCPLRHSVVPSTHFPFFNSFSLNFYEYQTFLLSFFKFLSFILYQIKLFELEHPTSQTLQRNFVFSFQPTTFYFSRLLSGLVFQTSCVSQSLRYPSSQLLERSVYFLPSSSQHASGIIWRS
jgi:hypothetical protein